MSKKRTRYAEGTTVSVAQSRTEIEAFLIKQGVDQQSFSRDNTGRNRITFRYKGRFAQLDMQVDPHIHDQRKREQAERETLRRILLVLKGKFELIAGGDTTFEREFLSDLLLPNGQTVHEAIRGHLATAYETGSMPLLLPEYKT